MNLLETLRRYLCLGVGEQDGGADPPGSDPAPDADDDSLEGLLDASDAGDTPPAEDDPAAELARTRKEAREAREELERERTARRDAETRASIQPVRAAPDTEYEREEAELAQARASGATAEQVSWLQWKIDSNRKMRTSERNSQSALSEARDVADKTAFDLLQTTKPQVYKRYADRVEKAIADLHAKGQNAPRVAVLRFLIGEDIMNGKVKPKTAKPAEGAAASGNRVDRGRTPGARTDVTAKGNLNDKQKRAERLRNQFI